jgi:hypothetical protein
VIALALGSSKGGAIVASMVESLILLSRDTNQHIIIHLLSRNRESR